MIDWDRVQELKDEVGSDDFAEVVDLFLEEVQDVIDRLEALSDRAKLEQDLHFLKGSALNLGFNDFSALCQDGERLSSESRASEVDLPSIIECYTLSRDCFMSGLNGETTT
ncbi:Hpt domain-containing protein [Primorskyibacter sp. S87]|uniref:Hpt domain-containing protein n=1 Tax=Primorskyibacter sp. S87 TaxID=3415126 RepID=UPI003C7AF4B3